MKYQNNFNTFFKDRTVPDTREPMNLNGPYTESFNTFVKELSLERYRETLFREWGKSGSLNFITGFLSREYIIGAAEITGIDNDFVGKIIDTAEEIKNSANLKRLFAHQHYLLFISRNSPENIASSFPDMCNILGNQGFTYNLLLALSGMESTKAYFESLKMPEDVMLGALKDIGIWVKHFHDNHGVIGISPLILKWERGLMRGSLYRLGRLQFTIRPFDGRILVFRNKNGNKVQALVQGDIPINSAGQFDGVDNHFDAKAWQSVLVREEKLITGNPVTPGGKVLSETLSLNLNDWDEVLTQGDQILDIHIPAGRDFNIQTCREAIDYSIDFFARYFPDKPFKGWACHSWFLDNQYEKILSGHSNILDFQHELYLYPTDAGGSEAYKRIFGERGIKDGIAKILQGSSMQKAVAGFIEKGGRLRTGGGFFLKEDLPWGRQVYKQNLHQW